MTPDNATAERLRSHSVPLPNKLPRRNVPTPNNAAEIVPPPPELAMTVGFVDEDPARYHMMCDYSAEEQRQLARYTYAYSDIMWVGSRGRGYDYEWRHRRIWSSAPPLSHERLRSAFGLMLDAAGRIGVSDATEPAVLAWQAALRISEAYHDEQRLKVGTADIIASATIIEAVAWLLRTKKLFTISGAARWKIRTTDWASTAYLVAGDSSRDVAAIFGTNHKSLLERRDRDFALIEKSFGRYCKNYRELWIPPQNANRKRYNREIALKDVESEWRTIRPALLTKPQAPPPSRRHHWSTPWVVEIEPGIVPWQPKGLTTTICPAGLAEDYPASAYETLPFQSWLRSTESEPAVRYCVNAADCQYFQRDLDRQDTAPLTTEYATQPDGTPLIIHTHPQRAWHFGLTPWRLGDAANHKSEQEFYLAGARNRSLSERDAKRRDRETDIAERIKDVLTADSYRRFAS